jgi:hypothetical protein
MSITTGADSATDTSDGLIANKLYSTCEGISIGSVFFCQIGARLSDDY